DVKGIVEVVCDALEVPIRFEPSRDGVLVPGRSASIVVNGGPAKEAAVGIAGQVAPAHAEMRGLPRQDAVDVAELDLDILAGARVPRPEAGVPRPRYPAVVRDLSIVVEETLPAAIIRGTIQAAGAAGRAPLASIAFFDRYQGKGVPDSKVSVSIRLVFQAADRTLT